MGKNTIERINYIDALLRNNRYPTKRSVSEHFEVSTKTIDRDIEYMRDRLGAPIAYDRTRRGYYYSETGYFVPSIHMNEEEALALFISHFLGTAWKGTPLSETAERLLRRYSESLDEKIVLDTSVFHESVFIIDQTVEIHKEHWLQLFSCARNRKKIEVTYQSPSYDFPHKRILHPYKLIHHRNAWYVIGFDEFHNEVRIYNVSRIQQINELKDSFSIDDNFDLFDYIDPQFGIFPGIEWFIVKMTADSLMARIIFEHIPKRNAKITELHSGLFEISFETNQNEELIHWVQQWGNTLEVIEPEWLRKKLKNLGKFYLETYHDE